MTISVKVGLVRLTFRFNQSRRPLQERDSDLMWAGFHGNAHDKVFVDIAIVGCFGRFSLRARSRLDRKQLQAPPVDRDFHLVGIGESFNVLVQELKALGIHVNMGANVSSGYGLGNRSAIGNGSEEQ